METIRQMSILASAQKEKQDNEAFSEFLLLFTETINDCVSQTVGVMLDDGLICHCEIL